MFIMSSTTEMSRELRMTRLVSKSDEYFESRLL